MRIAERREKEKVFILFQYNFSLVRNSWEPVRETFTVVLINWLPIAADATFSEQMAAIAPHSALRHS